MAQRLGRSGALRVGPGCRGPERSGGYFLKWSSRTQFPGVASYRQHHQPFMARFVTELAANDGLLKSFPLNLMRPSLWTTARKVFFRYIHRIGIRDETYGANVGFRAFESPRVFLDGPSRIGPKSRDISFFWCSEMRLLK